MSHHLNKEKHRSAYCFNKKGKFAQIPSRSAMENRKIANFKNAFRKFAQTIFVKAMHKLFRSATILLSYCSFCMNTLSITQAGKPGMERSVLQARSHSCTVFLGMTLGYSSASSYQGILMASAELYMLGEPAKGQYHPIQGRGGEATVPVA